MATLDALLPGSLIAEKYLVDREIGRGGMGVVLSAQHVTLGTRVALKVLTVPPSSSGDAVARFLREARATAMLKSEFVARVADFGALPDGRPFMVLELLEGDDLSELIARSLPSEEVVDAICQACAGLAEAHAAGIVHRDLKPSNLFRTRRPDGSACTKVLDFGISKLVGAASDAQLVSTDTSAVLGTPLYMSPEQVRSTRDADARSDIWSLGVVLVEALTGEAPFVGRTLGEVFSRILEATPHIGPRGATLHPDLMATVLRCLEKRSDARFTSVAELAERLAPFASIEGREAARRARDTTARGLARIPSSSMPAVDVASAPTASIEAATAETLEVRDGAAIAERARPAGGQTAVGATDIALPEGAGAQRGGGRWLLVGAVVAVVGAVATFALVGNGSGETSGAIASSEPRVAAPSATPAAVASATPPSNLVTPEGSAPPPRTAASTAAATVPPLPAGSAFEAKPAVPVVPATSAKRAAAPPASAPPKRPTLD